MAWVGESDIVCEDKHAEENNSSKGVVDDVQRMPSSSNGEGMLSIEMPTAL